MGRACGFRAPLTRQQRDQSLDLRFRDTETPVPVPTNGGHRCAPVQALPEVIGARNRDEPFAAFEHAFLTATFHDDFIAAFRFNRLNRPEECTEGQDGKRVRSEERHRRQ
jgi:hypothetical protein